MRESKRFLKIVVLSCVLVSVGLLILVLFGYGHLQIEVPDDAVVQINGHPVKSQKLKLRFGRYDAIVSGPNYKLSSTKINVPLLGTAIYKPSLQPRNDDSILTSSLVVDGAFGTPEFTSSQWFGNNQWVAGQLSLSGNFVALHYQSGSWKVAYYQPGENYPNDIAQLPQDIAAYLKKGEANYGTQQH